MEFDSGWLPGTGGVVVARDFLDLHDLVGPTYLGRPRRSVLIFLQLPSFQTRITKVELLWSEY